VRVSGRVILRTLLRSSALALASMSVVSMSVRGKGKGKGKGLAVLVLVLVALAAAPLPACSFMAAARAPVRRQSGGAGVGVLRSAPEIESPFAAPGTLSDDDDDDSLLPLTLDNVEKVLDEMRPYLMSDGGNVAVSEIDGPVVKLELQGACGTCPSSTMTMKMGLERRLMERIPEIQEVIQAIPDGPTLSVDNIEGVLDGVRPFLSVAGGSIEVESLQGVGGLQPRLALRMEGNSSSLQSVKMEIMQRIQRTFMASGLRIEFV
jgi:Fe-S cluster biogenesis protein NfuA